MSHDLDLLKKHWQEENHFKKYSEQELFIMTKKKSLSIARWLLLIGFIELLFWAGINHFLPQGNNDLALKIIPQKALYILDTTFKTLPYLLIGGLFCSNYMIAVENSPKKLLRRILGMRQLVRLYVLLVVAIMNISFILGIYYGIHYHINCNHSPNFASLSLIIVASLVIITIFILVLTLLYRLIYGKMLKRLEETDIAEALGIEGLRSLSTEPWVVTPPSE